VVVKWKITEGILKQIDVRID